MVESSSELFKVIGAAAGLGTLLKMFWDKTESAEKKRKEQIRTEIELVLGREITEIKLTLINLSAMVNTTIPAVAQGVATAMAQQTQGIVKQTMDASTSQIFACARELVDIKDGGKHQ